MNHYLRNNHPIKINNPMSGDISIIGGEIEYKRICKEKNVQLEADRLKTEAELQPQKEREKLIQERMNNILKETAKQQLIDEGIIDPEEEE